jgi:hypothetical protein
MDYVYRLFKERDTPHMTPERIHALFTEAGFENIEIVEKLMDIGDWRKGTFIHEQ